MTSKYTETFEVDRNAAYQCLWGLIPDLGATLQDEQQVRKALEEVHTFLRANDVYIEERAGSLAIQYLQNGLKLREILSEMESRMGDERVEREAQVRRISTDSVPSPPGPETQVSSALRMFIDRIKSKLGYLP